MPEEPRESELMAGDDHDCSNRTLYHYTSLEGLLGILGSHCIWATMIEDLADKTELVYGRELIARRFDLEAKRVGDPALSSKLKNCADCTRALPCISELVRRAGLKPKIDDAKYEWYIACFSEERDYLPLWRGFTDRCTGYAIGLKYRAPKSRLRVHWPPRQVVYSRDEQRDLVRQMVDRARDSFSLKKTGDAFAWILAMEPIVTLKSPLFSSEREWRVVWNDTDTRRLTRGQFQPDGNPRPVRYVKLPLDDWEIVEIVCGPRAEHGPGCSVINRAIGAFREGNPNVNVAKSAYCLWR
jgi:hypothetical protein